LNQIAPQPTRNKFDLLHQKPSRLALIGLGVAFVVVILLSIVIGIMTGDNNIEHLAARLNSTQSTAISATNNIKSTQLRALNSSLKLYLTNTIRDATPIFDKNGVKVDSLSSSVTKTESNTKMLATLEDARLNAIYDRVYAREMAYQLDNVITLMRQIYSSTNSSNLKNFLNSSYKSLEPTQKQFADFNAANS
jgi:dGTP triphosphohydrolase